MHRVKIFLQMLFEKDVGHNASFKTRLYTNYDLFLRNFQYTLGIKHAAMHLKKVSTYSCKVEERSHGFESPC